jgi:hypothetical protein
VKAIHLRRRGLVVNMTGICLLNWRNLPLRLITPQLSAIITNAAHTGVHLVKRGHSSFRLISARDHPSSSRVSPLKIGVDVLKLAA